MKRSKETGTGINRQIAIEARSSYCGNCGKSKCVCRRNQEQVMVKIKTRSKPVAPEPGKIVIEYVNYYSVELCRKHKNKIFVFGDNLARYGKKGQSVIRDEPNAFGVVTKVLPSTAEDAYFSDADYEENTNAMFEDLKIIQVAALKGRIVVWPKEGIGTGLSGLQEKAPVTWQALQRLQYSMLGIKLKS